MLNHISFDSVKVGDIILDNTGEKYKVLHKVYGAKSFVISSEEENEAGWPIFEHQFLWFKKQGNKRIG